MMISVELDDDLENRIVVSSLKSVVAALSNLNNYGRLIDPNWERSINAAKCMIDYYSVQE